jgi:multiple sugar transport system permease protein
MMGIGVGRLTRPEAGSRRALGKKRSRRILNAFSHFICILFSLAFMGPFFWTVSSSLKKVPELFLYPPLLFPAEPQWHNYVGQWTFNTLLITFISLVGSISSSTLVAYSLARFRYPLRDAIFLFTLSTMMLPIEVTIIPLYLLFNKIGWLDTFMPLTVPAWFGGGAFNIFLMRQFFMTIPRDMDEAAVIDGAGPFHILRAILLPLCKPVLATMAVIGFISHWNQFLQPLIFLNSSEKLTLSVGLRYFQTQRYMGGEAMEHLLMAVSVMMAAPCLLLFFLAQRYFVHGIVMSGIKG